MQKPANLLEYSPLLLSCNIRLASCIVTSWGATSRSLKCVITWKVIKAAQRIWRFVLHWTSFLIEKTNQIFMGSKASLLVLNGFNVCQHYKNIYTIGHRLRSTPTKGLRLTVPNVPWRSTHPSINRGQRCLTSVTCHLTSLDRYRETSQGHDNKMQDLREAIDNWYKTNHIRLRTRK